MDLAPYIGLPFGEGAGEVTCWSLVRRVYADQFGIDLPSYGDVGARDLVRVAHEMRDGAARECWMEPDQLGVGDVVLMRSARGGRAVCHVGVLVDLNLVLHAEEGTGSVVVPAAHFTVAGRIAGYRRYVGSVEA